MATQTLTYTTPTAIATALSTELNSLANGAYSAASPAIDPLGKPYVGLELQLASLTPVAGQQVGVWLLPSIDGSTYPDGGGAVAPSDDNFLVAIPLSTGTGAKIRTRIARIEHPFLFKFVVGNILIASGVAFGATGNTLKYRFFTEQSA